MEDGEEIVNAPCDEPAFRFIPAKQADGFVSLAGAWQGRVTVSDDFDELPADLAESLGIES
jgi:antitoxin (DNA-binding transcriptional repressor) of toxin-antitoxin stability system